MRTPAPNTTARTRGSARSAGDSVSSHAAFLPAPRSRARTSATIAGRPRCAASSATGARSSSNGAYAAPPVGVPSTDAQIQSTVPAGGSQRAARPLRERGGRRAPDEADVARTGGLQHPVDAGERAPERGGTARACGCAARPCRGRGAGARAGAAARARSRAPRWRRRRRPPRRRARRPRPTSASAGGPSRGARGAGRGEAAPPIRPGCPRARASVRPAPPRRPGATSRPSRSQASPPSSRPPRGRRSAAPSHRPRTLAAQGRARWRAQPRPPARTCSRTSCDLAARALSHVVPEGRMPSFNARRSMKVHRGSPIRCARIGGHLPMGLDGCLFSPPAGCRAPPSSRRPSPCPSQPPQPPPRRPPACPPTRSARGS